MVLTSAFLPGWKRTERLLHIILKQGNAIRGYCACTCIYEIFAFEEIHSFMIWIANILLQSVYLMYVDCLSGHPSGPMGCRPQFSRNLAIAIYKR